MAVVIAVGTTSKQKLGYVASVLTELGIKAETRPHAVPSGVSDQPITDAETLAGAANRAKAALALEAEADYGLGIEVGYDQDEQGRYAIFCWAVTVDREGRLATAKSHPFLLPGFHQLIMDKGDYLGDFVHDYCAHMAEDPVGRYVAEALRDRTLFIQESLRYALIYTFHREFYAD